MSKKITKRNKKGTTSTNRTPAVPSLWKVICRRPTLSVWTKSLFKRDSHKKKAGTIKVDKKSAAAKKKEGKKRG